ncbi:hypothetical protein [Ktedonospora formicarum]|uniref:hypothetical protein n=1 Tax=Ktedonospora formicarum TaxID=2778364 RepID=UPI001C688ED3|nr:hypothetical protein [Ktedonospora formicarum]
MRSSREITGRGTAPWDHELEHRTAFLGVESLAGYVINTGNARVIADRSDGFQLFPVVWDEHEQSSMAHPIMLGNTIAGCLLGSSTRPKFFLSRSHQALFAAYTKLLNLAFSADDYVPLDMVELYPMPLPANQQQFLTHFRSRVTQVMIHNQLTVGKAEDEVWCQIEKDLLQYQMQHA